MIKLITEMDVIMNKYSHYLHSTLLTLSQVCFWVKTKIISVA